MLAVEKLWLYPAEYEESSLISWSLRGGSGAFTLNTCNTGENKCLTLPATASA